jgi:hypothetical protein
MTTTEKLNTLLEKYEMRKEECEEQFDDDLKELKLKDNSLERISWLNDDMRLINAQIGAYECIIKDLKEWQKNETCR